MLCVARVKIVLFCNLFNKQVSNLVEFIEVNRVMGVEKFHFYVESAAPSVVACLREYVRRGIVDLQPWAMPADVGRVIYYHGQIMAMNECLYRMMYRTRYLVIQDLDEFVVPMLGDGWRSILDAVHSGTAAGGSDRIASYSFRSRFFPIELISKTSISNLSSAAKITEHRFRTLSLTQAGERLFPHTERSKVMARPERVIVWHVHVILDSSLVRRGDVNARVDEKYAQLFHYRHGAGVSKTTAVSRLKEFEPQILRRLNVATAAICLTGDYQFP